MRPLEGVQVLDLSNVLAGPFAAYQLHLLGAQVLKIESPSGDLARELGADPAASANKMGLSFVAQNAGKQSVVLDLKSDQGREQFLSLVRGADVVLENFRPGVMARLGLDFEVLTSENPRLIYCAISGFGQTGPLAHQPAYDQIIQGYSGVMDITGHETGPPTRAGFPISDTLGGLSAALAVAAALNDRSRAHFIDVSMLESTLSTMGWAVSNFLQGGVEARRMGNDNMTSAPSGAFATADGLINIAANQDRHWQQLCRAMEHPEWLSDQRFQDRESRKLNRQALTQQIEAVLQTQPRDYWILRFGEFDIPCGPVLSVAEALQLEQLRDRNFVDRSAAALVTNGYLYDGTRLTPTGPAPKLDEHGAKWRDE